jgi:hypothetical protein
MRGKRGGNHLQVGLLRIDEAVHVWREENSRMRNNPSSPLCPFHCPPSSSLHIPMLVVHRSRMLRFQQ